ncbi:hypothetical protein PHYSODRAFT_299757 [Phytophthora sojae]|uniref:Uncharacterized protein n=1 Tax=Phytophthora sojae (strain P6497) TaxID=1094619 RepID=G4Z7X5_PHYSP|nr:hypothetical protein PHYSODRAFT_299757 [Phytophthora sojae]EGZ22510.1 hypothetical protein PHYSODRAFT_299757 [Phytophthora sojae]|eukprot:XP_009525227.1 hypothetical protein PHYSODRAFT_299757 [Phytophthora sojae]
MDLVFPGTLNQVVRRPDTAMRPFVSAEGESPVSPRLIVEIEIGNKSILQAQQYCREYFDLIPLLRAALLIKFFPARNGVFACVAILYRRSGDDDDEVVVADVVNFGSASIPDYAERDLEQEPRILPLAPPYNPNEASVSSWRAHHHPFVEIPAEDVFYRILERYSGRRVNPRALPALRIDLWEIYQLVEGILF